MEIDLLRPKNIPVSEEIQWFEFLLDKNLLEKHLFDTENSNPPQLLRQFLSIIPESQPNDLNSPDVDLSKNEGLLFHRKHLALKILALKVAGFLKWNLETLEKSLPLQKQVQILGDLCSITSGRIVNLPLSLVHEVQAIGSDGNKAALNFALTLYHRWVLRAQVLKGSYTKIKPFVHVVSTPEQTNGYSIQDDLFIASLEPCTPTSIDFLNQIIADTEPFKILKFNSFVPLDSGTETNQQKIESSQSISKTELKTQIYYDLAFYYMFIKKYDLAKENIILCRDNLIELKKEYYGKLPGEYEFCTVTDDELKGYLMACGVFDETPNLMQKMNKSMLEKYKDIVEILKEDNFLKEIPMIQRKIMELDIEAISTSQKEFIDLEFKVVALNTIRYIIEENNILSSDTFKQKYKNNYQKVLEYFIEFSNEIVSKTTPSERNAIKKYLLDIFLTNSNEKIEILLKKSAYFTKKEIDTLKIQTAENAVPQLVEATKNDWNVCDTANQRIEVGMLERQVITATTAMAIRKLLVKLAKTNPTQPLWKINNNWQIPLAVKQVVLTLPSGFLQDFSYILLGRARELVARKDYHAAIAMLMVLKGDIQRSESSDNPSKLFKMVTWEIVNIQAIQCLDEWHKKLSDQAWVKCLKGCLLHLQSTSYNHDYPRMEIVDNAIMILMNLNEWNACVLIDTKRDPILELCSLLASIMTDFEKYKHGQIAKKFNLDVWNLVLPIFSQQQSQIQNMKRSASVSGRSSGASSEPQSLLTLIMFRQFCDKLRDPLLITVVMSLLAKIHNILKDESNFDLTIDYLPIWPGTISNANAYNVKLVAETLNQLLRQSLKYYPNNLIWLKLKGDLEFVVGNNEIAMKNYVQCLILSTEYCTLQMQRPLLDDYIIKKMIKCCQNLGSYFQAAVLCQFLDEIDYQLAFKCISEKNSVCTDAMDSYYSCIWDPTLLEFIVNMHHKKGEHKRRLQAISHMSQLELNANNNDEIKREASSIRKIKFLRSLARQYM